MGVLIVIVDPCGMDGIDIGVIVGGVLSTIMFRSEVALVTHVFMEATKIVPPMVPAFTVIEVVVERPVHPDGKVQT